jgi:chromosome segregation ATPase
MPRSRFVAELETPIEELRERLTSLLADWGAELSMVLRELDAKRLRLEELEELAASHDGNVKELNKRIEDQGGLIEALREDADRVSTLRRELDAKDGEMQRLRSELSSKQELIKALRRDAEQADRLRSEATVKDKEIAQLKADNGRAEQRSRELAKELESSRQTAESGQAAAELEAVRAELEARKTLIRSLRADAERAAALEARLEEKREVIEKLESSINHHSDTIAELKRNAESWKKHCETLKEARPAGLAALSSSELSEIEGSSIGQERPEDRTIAIDMRDSLLEARRTAGRGRGKQ